MKQMMKRGLAILMALVICVGLLPSVRIFAANSTVDYVTGSSGYIYNWGERGEDATFLSPNAVDFYEDNNTSYEKLSANAGGSGVSNAPNSALYNVLKNLMVNNHSHKTSYSETKNLYQYTDCQNNGGKISSFYSGREIGPEWDGSSWNREHTWPNSKGLDGDDENDIMMLRPTSSIENSSRGNKAYGKSSGYYNPNGESGGNLDLRGDVARIFLYVYVRWGNTNGNGQYSTWGTNGVIESVSVLLEWMEADPVDTWELGRNDSVESITGTRNVFVDYPEFAFLLFGAEIPDDMTTPSGMANGSGSCDHRYVAGAPVAATCTTQGYTVYTCSLCKNSYQDNFVAALGHNYVKGNVVPATCTQTGYTVYTCSRCSDSKQDDITEKTAHTYVNGTCSSCGAVKRNEGDPVTVTTVVGDYAATNKWSNGVKYTTLEMDNVITVSADTAKKWQYTGNYYTSDQTWRIYQTDGGQIKITAADSATISSVKFTFTTANNGALYYNGSKVTSGTAINVNGATSAVFTVGNTGSGSNGQIRVSKIEVSYIPMEEEEPHVHTPASAVIEDLVEQTCTTSGSYVAVVYCLDPECCEELSRTTVVLAATGHKDDVADHKCDDCGEVLTECADNNNDGKCDICGADLGPVVDANLKFYSVGLVLGADIRGVFQISYKPASSKYVSFKVFIDGEEVALTTTSSYGKTTYLGYAVNFAAKEMADEVTATIIGVTAEGEEFASEPMIWSIKQGAFAMLDERASKDTEAARNQMILIANMLNYGAEAQKNFGYNTENLATDGLKDEYKALITTTTPVMNAIPKADETGATATLYGVSLNLASKVEVMATFKVAKNQNVADYKAVVVQKHTKADGTVEEETFEVAGEKLVLSNRYLGVYLDDVESSEMRDTLTITLYKNDVAVSVAQTCSVESACNTMLANYPDLIPALMNYGDAAYKVFD